MPPSDLRRPARWRGPVRGQVAAWSVLPAAAVVIIVGGLFWASVWIVFRTPTATHAVASPNASELVASSEPSDADALPVDETYDSDVDVTDDIAARERPDDKAIAFAVRGPGSADENAYVDSVDDEQVAEDPITAPDEIALGPLYGPPYIPGPYDDSDSPDAVASDDGSGDQATNRAGMLAERAAEITSRTQELAAKAEELTARIEGLTSRMEELQTRIEVSGNVLAAQPAIAPSPVPLARPANETVAARSTGATGTTGTAGANGTTGQAAPSGRSPWVVMPQPGPGSRVAAGPVTLEARARGEAPIAQIRLQLDGVALQVAMERRDDTTWRGHAAIRVTPGSHSVAISVVDEKGRVGSYRWQFDASGS